jgi:hypothetical protein
MSKMPEVARVARDRHRFRKRLAALGFENYDAYLASPHWAEVKRQYRLSGKPQACVACGSRSFQIHHRTYERLGNEHMQDLDALCRSCHRAAHLLLAQNVPGITLWNVSRRIQEHIADQPDDGFRVIKLPSAGRPAAYRTFNRVPPRQRKRSKQKRTRPTQTISASDLESTKIGWKMPGTRRRKPARTPNASGIKS